MSNLPNNQSSSQDEMKKKGIVSFRLKPQDYDTIERYVVPAFYKNQNIKTPTVGALAKHFLIANSSKYIKYVEDAYKQRQAQVQAQAQQQKGVGIGDGDITSVF